MSNDSENIIDVNRDKTIFSLSDVARINANRINERKSKNLNLAKHYYKKVNDLKILGQITDKAQKRASRVYSCCLQRYIVVVNNQSYNIFTHRCRDRHCPECQRIKAFVWQQKIEQISDQLVKSYGTDAAIFGTLTVKNPPIVDLGKHLKAMSKAFARMLQRKAFRFARGGFRCFETTRGNTGSEFCHPHIHFFLQVDGSYFDKGNPDFLSSEEWARHWTECYAAECVKAGLTFSYDDYVDGKAFVKVLRVMTPEGIERKKNKQKVRKADYLVIKDLKKSGGSVVNYVLKYTQKEGDLFTGDKWSWEYDKQIKGIRMIAPFGIYREELKKIDKPIYSEKSYKEELSKRINSTDLNNANVDLDNADFYITGYIDDKKEYQAKKVESVEAFAIKRSAIVKSIKTHIADLNVFNKERDNTLNKALNEFDKDPNVITLNKVNKVISEINEHRKRLLNNHNRLVRVGDRIQINEDQYFDLSICEVFDMNDFVELDYLHADDFFNDYELTEESPF